MRLNNIKSNTDTFLRLARSISTIVDNEGRTKSIEYFATLEATRNLESCILLFTQNIEVFGETACTFQLHCPLEILKRNSSKFGF